MYCRRRVAWQCQLALGCIAMLLTLSRVAIPATGSPLLPPLNLQAPAQPVSMPAFNLPNADGTQVRSTDLQGKVVVVRFWATWWPICRGEMPSVQRAHDDLKNQGVVILAVSLDGDGMAAVRHFLATDPYTMPILVDTGMETARKFGARGVPMTYVIDRQGRIVAGGFGPVDFDHPAFRAYIQALLAQPQG